MMKLGTFSILSIQFKSKKNHAVTIEDHLGVFLPSQGKRPPIIYSIGTNIQSTMLFIGTEKIMRVCSKKNTKIVT